MSHGQRMKALVNHLKEANNTRQGVQPLRSLVENLTIEEAYRIQLEGIQAQVARGWQVTGKKIGLTSLAMQQSLGVTEPDYGHLLDNMLIQGDGKISQDRVLQPRVEAEFAFVLKADLVGPNISSFAVVQATDYVVPALEIVDSRISNWDIQLVDTVGDNASSGLYRLSDRQVKLTEIDLKNTGMSLYKNDDLVNTGAGVACLGDPVRAVAWLANKLSQYEIGLKAGEVILSGALSAAVPAQSGDRFVADFSELGQVNVEFL